MNREEAERNLDNWATVMNDRDRLVCEAVAAGVPKHRVFVITGLSRSTIDRILSRDEPTE